MWRVPLILVSLALIGLAPASARAAFPGRDGLLAVQPVHGNGVVLVSPSGRSERRICVSGDCAGAAGPRWSPNGQEIVYGSDGGTPVGIVYPDGSCLNCQFGHANHPAFEPNGTLISFPSRGALAVDGIDGIRQTTAPPGSASDGVWAADGRLAVIRKGVVFAGLPGRLHRLGPGTEPSWAPSGDAVAAAAGGWIVLLPVDGGRARRLVRGSAPAFSPDGRSVAYVGVGRRLMLVPASGGRPRTVGDVDALSVDWQPLPGRPAARCTAPPGSYVLASSPSALVSSDTSRVVPASETSGAQAVIGCLRSTGRERLLESFPPDDFDRDSEGAAGAEVAAPYAAVLLSGYSYSSGSGEAIDIFDLRTGRAKPRLGGEQAECVDQGVGCQTIDSYVVGSDGASAADVQAVDPSGSFAQQLSTVSCAPGGPPCAATDWHGRVLTTSDPTGGAGTWTTTAPNGNPGFGGAQSVSCPSVSLCVAVGLSTAYSTSDPAGSPPTWTSAALPDAPDVGSVTCPTTAACLATGENGALATSTDPADGIWSTGTIDDGRSLGRAVCTSASFCFVADDTGRVMSSTDPAVGATTWNTNPQIPGFVSASCPTVSLCVSVNNSDAIATSTNPGSGPWTRTATTSQVLAVSCPTISLCVAVGMLGDMYVSTDPAAGTWTASTLIGGVSAMTCASTSLCLAVDTAGHVYSSTDPAGGGSTWRVAYVDGDPCTNGTPCSVEQILASAGNGVQTLDSSESPGTGPFLTDLRLNGDVLSWRHDGSPRTATLGP